MEGLSIGVLLRLKTPISRIPLIQYKMRLKAELIPIQDEAEIK
jgi:hypothetical protein